MAEQKKIEAELLKACMEDCAGDKECAADCKKPPKPAGGRKEAGLRQPHAIASAPDLPPHPRPLELVA